MTGRQWHWTIGLIQLAIMIGVGCAVLSFDPKMNPLIPGVFGVLSAYGFTVVIIRLIDRRVRRRNHGEADASRP